jgi:hypothetical protein
LIDVEAGMLRRTILCVVIGWTVLIDLDLIHAQSTFVSAYYQITAGDYAECCGFAGPFAYNLPDDNQAFVELIIDPGGTTARLTFLQPDMQTVFTTHPTPASEFPFTFDRGIVSSNSIQFTSGGPIPLLLRGSWDYTVTNRNGGIGIYGTVVTERAGADVPNRFEHTNVVAIRISNPIQIDQIQHDSNTIQFHFTGPPPYDYTAESTSSLSSTNWEQIGTYRAKLQAIDITVTQLLATAETKFFRVRQQPCGCR